MTSSSKLQSCQHGTGIAVKVNLRCLRMHHFRTPVWLMAAGSDKRVLLRTRLLVGSDSRRAGFPALLNSELRYSTGMRKYSAGPLQKVRRPSPWKRSSTAGLLANSCAA